DSFLTENAIDRKNVYNLAFTFSFPVAQTGIAAGTLIVWTKGFTATGVEGEDVVALLNDALRRRNICCINVTALANDTVGTLAARSYGDPTCDMGVILGTGTNGCYREKISNIPKLKGHDPDEYMIVNMEWGNFDKLRRTRYDKQVDESSLNPGAMFLEKMVSGMYLGELARLIIMDLIERGLLFLNESTAAGNFGEKDSLKTQYMSLIAGDATADLGETATFLNNKGITNTALRDRILLKRFCQIVSARSARLGAAAISAVVTWMDPGLNERHTVAVDGSLFEKYPGFEDEMKKVFKELFGGSAGRITLAHSKDGSGKGAAIIAAAAASKK
ncbi:MAG: hexokinase, partial [Deltaproteobacteria bacterium]|nr:hexokinase [Deltaproteobacteria bacterium]